MQEERRRTDDIRFPLGVSAWTEPRAGGRRIPGRAANLSRGGMLLQSPQAARPGAAVRVTLRLQQRPPLSLVGTIVWGQRILGAGWELGIQFREELAGDLVATLVKEEKPCAPRAERRTEDGGTYNALSLWVWRRYERQIATCWIAHVKELNALPVRRAANRRPGRAREHPCPPWARPLIEAALRHFGQL